MTTNNFFKRIFAIFLAAVMLLGMIPSTVFATEDTIETDNTDLNGDKRAEVIDDEHYEVSIEVPGGDAEVKHDEIILMVDGSYSMDNEWPAMKEAINTIGEAVLDGSGHTQLTLMAFGMGDNKVLVHVKKAEELAAALGELPGTLLYGRSSTNCEAGFTGVAEYITNHDETLGDVQVIFISDGNVNTDETPRAFDANWQTWTRFGALAVGQETFGGAVSNGENLPAAFTTVFGDRFAGATKEEIITRAFGGEVTDEEFLTFAEQLWTDVYAYSGLTRGAEYPVSDAERAFVKYDKENGTYIQDLFYYTTYKSAYVTYGNRWTRTPVAADALAAMDKVTNLYVVDYDGYTAWMDTGITSEKSTFIKSNGIAGLVDALADTLKVLSITQYNDVVISDYMSKWVHLDPSTLHIIDNKSGKTIWNAVEGWFIGEGRPTAQENPVIVELVDPADYVAGGTDVIGNTSGDIYKLTWYVKDGALLRSDNYKLAYEVTVDTEEEGFNYDTQYPANGNTEITYTTGGVRITNPIVVPLVIANDPKDVTVSGVKTWNDEDDRDGIRPESITINLLANGKVIDSKVVTEADGWAWTFENLYKYENGEEIVYSIEEVAVEGYEAAVDGLNVTNTYVPEKITVSGTKTWVDDDNADGIRPESITINLLANGTVVDTKVVTEADGWAWTFEDLYKYENGEEIEYTITEDAVEGYETVVDGFNVTNTHEAEKITVNGTKTWVDEDDADGIRPESITINLLANGTVVDTKTVTEADGWAWTFENLYKYENGEEIEYTITEDAVEGYETVVDGYNVTNTHEVEEEIDEDPVPLTPADKKPEEKPEVKPEKEEIVEIEDEEIPLAPEFTAPQTGDTSSLFAWLAVAVVTGTLFIIASTKMRRASNER